MFEAMANNVTLTIGMFVYHSFASDFRSESPSTRGLGVTLLIGKISP
jgi:hypothetical protein